MASRSSNAKESNDRAKDRMEYRSLEKLWLPDDSSKTERRDEKTQYQIEVILEGKEAGLSIRLRE